MPPDGVVRRVVARCGLDPDLDLFVRLLITTGARRGEIAALRWVHVDWTSSVVIIDEALSETRTGVRIKETKTSSSTRRVGLDGDTLALLARRREAAGGYDEDWVFGGEAPVAPNVWSQRFARACAEVGVNLRMHDLRHWAASVWIDAGVPINVIAGRLGHARTSTTTDIYGHLLSRDDSALAGVVLDRFAPRDSG
jgi:integrase